MAAPQLFTQADLERRLGGVEYLIRFTDDDRDGVADSAVVTAIIDEASQLATGILWDGFPGYPLVSQLVAADVGVLGAIVDIGCGLVGQRRPDMQTANGDPILGWRRKQGESVLKAVAGARRRAAGEEVVGRNRILRQRTSRDIGETPFLFPRSSRDKKGPGGF